MSTQNQAAHAYLDEARRSLRGHKRLAEGAFEQVNDEEFFRLPDVAGNSIALLAKHMSGNMRSRFTDFLTSDGEKPDRMRDTEFEQHAQDSRAALIERWERGWQIVFAALDALTPEDLLRTVTIRRQPLSVLQAVHRQVAHYAYHVGQIVFLAKHWKGAEWKSLSIPRGRSNDVNFTQQAEKDRP